MSSNNQGQDDLQDESLQDDELQDGQEDSQEDAEPPIDDPMDGLDGRPKKDAPPEGSKRWNEIYRKAKEGERQAAEMAKSLEDTNTTLAELRTHNQEMAKVLEELRTTKPSIPDVNSPDAIRHKITEIRKQKAAAVEEENYKQATKLQDEIDELRDQLTERQLASVKMPDEKAIAGHAAQQAEFQVAVATLASEAPWFDPASEKYDAIMTGAAQAVDRQLANDPKWNTRALVEQYREVKRRVETRFGYGKSRTSPLVGRVGDSQVSSSGSLLTPEQLRVAKALFPDDPNAEVEYSKQLRVMKGGR